MWGKKSIKEDLRTEEIIEDFRSTFGTVQGKKVLGVILILGGFFNDDITEPESVGKRNLCTTILQFLGVEEVEERSNEFVEAFTGAIKNIIIKENKK